MHLAIITINYNSSESTLKLLRSLAEQTDKDFQIFVIDNASEEADFNNLKKYYTTNIDATRGALVANKENLGFSGGNNMGIKEALDPSTGSGQETAVNWVLLLNNDTWVEKDFIAVIKAKLELLKGIVGVPFLVEGSNIAYYGQVKWLKPTLPHAYQLLNNLIRHVNYYVIGGAMAIHRDVFEKIGLLDEKYFLYFEDVDYSIRARENDIPIEIWEKPIVHHTPSSTTQKLGKPLLLRYHYRNALYFNFKNGPWYIKLLVWPWSWWIVAKQLLKIMFMYKPDQSLAILKGVFGFYRNKMGKINEKYTF